MRHPLIFLSVAGAIVIVGLLALSRLPQRKSMQHQLAPGMFVRIDDAHQYRTPEGKELLRIICFFSGSNALTAPWGCDGVGPADDKQSINPKHGWSPTPESKEPGDQGWRLMLVVPDSPSYEHGLFIRFYRGQFPGNPTNQQVDINVSKYRKLKKVRPASALIPLNEFLERKQKKP